MNSKNKTAAILSALIISLSVICSPSQASQFDKGSITGTLAVGNGQLLTEDYFIIGIGAGYFVVDGLELGLDLSVWTGGEPDIYEVTPKVNFVFDNPSSVKPYLGTFYNRTFIDGFDDSNSLGYRAGFYSPVGKGAFIGIGAVYTDLQDCTETATSDCSSTYTELSFIFSL